MVLAYMPIKSFAVNIRSIRLMVENTLDGLPGLALQWALIPLAAYWTESLIAKRNH